MEGKCTTYYSTDSERPHCCCHLPNYLGSRLIFPVGLLYSGPRDPSPNCPSPEDPSRHLIHGSLSPPESTPKRFSINSVVSAQLMIVANRQTHRPRYICSSQLHRCPPCMQWGTKVCRCNWHSAGSPGWPFPMLKYYNKIHGSNFIK